MYKRSSNKKTILLITPCEPLSNKNKEIIHDMILGGKYVFLGVRDDSNTKYSALEIVGMTMDCFENYIKEKKMSVIVVPNVSTIEFLGSQKYEYC